MDGSIYSVVLSSPLGPVRIFCLKDCNNGNEYVVRIGFGHFCEEDRIWLKKRFPEYRPFDTCDCESEAGNLLERAAVQIMDYLSGQRTFFDLPYHIGGTDFQKAVWEEIARIPCGKTLSYGALAENIGRPGAGRAVGGACNRNPLPLIIPCHRVVGADGSLTGFGGGLHIKKHLLYLESQNR